MRGTGWRWVEEAVDTSQDHIEITYGKIRKDGPIGQNIFIPVALVAAPRRKTFKVQFLVKGNNAECPNMLAEVRKELDFYLTEIAGGSRLPPWQYVKYHCGTAANLYSNVHWNILPVPDTDPRP